MVNPFNGEGIAYAMESGEIAAEVIAQALARPTAAGRERALAALPARRSRQTLRRLLHARARVREAHRRPQVMQLATRHGLPHPMLMRFTLKLLANLTDPRGGDAMDRLINALSPTGPGGVTRVGGPSAP